MICDDERDLLELFGKALKSKYNVILVGSGGKEYNGTKIILICAYNLDDALVKDLIENNSIAKYREKPILINSLIELVSKMLSLQS